MKNYDLKNIAIVKVDNYVLPQFSEYSGSLSDLDVESGRNVNGGVMERNRIRSDIHKLEFSYDILTYDVARDILQAIKPSSFNVEFFAIDLGKRITKKMYVGDKSFQWIMAIPKGKSDFEICVKDLKFNFIEN